MLTALNESNQIISLLNQEIPENQAFRCPGCYLPVRLRNGKMIRPHFAHIQLEHCRFQMENESEEHLHLKAKMYASLANTEEVCVEKYFPSFCQIADLLVNTKLALEIQCSSLPIERLIERTRAYQQHGYEVRWLLGKKLWLKQKLTALQKQCLYFSQTIGFHLWELDLEQNVLRLKYLIHEDLFGNVTYLTKSVSLENNLITFLRFPYQQQPLFSYQQVMNPKLSIMIQRALLAKHPKWLQRQEKAYLAGKNLLTLPIDAFYPQLRPVQSTAGFCQIHEDLRAYYSFFKSYYKKESNKKVQTLFSPKYYAKIDNNQK
ncbi:competence protein CoiA [Streptococcus castoreus]|uniref:competence protein CoiA n=1 Tax=Streptococcus castoreus TaxID=254786 RepID=UPI000408BEC4|nr:competence protein CoiA family protein [Streptococcus castoreus]